MPVLPPSCFYDHEYRGNLVVENFFAHRLWYAQGQEYETSYQDWCRSQEWRCRPCGRHEVMAWFCEQDAKIGFMTEQHEVLKEFLVFLDAIFAELRATRATQPVHGSQDDEFEPMLMVHAKIANQAAHVR